jgi:hypothetical protein
MPGIKTAGWYLMDESIRDLTGATFAADKKASDSEILFQTADGLADFAAGVQMSIQELYERMERLHQKIDRIEKKVGSVPGAK